MTTQIIVCAFCRERPLDLAGNGTCGAERCNQGAHASGCIKRFQRIDKLVSAAQTSHKPELFLAAARAEHTRLVKVMDADAEYALAEVLQWCPPCKRSRTQSPAPDATRAPVPVPLPKLPRMDKWDALEMERRHLQEFDIRFRFLLEDGERPSVASLQQSVLACFRGASSDVVNVIRRSMLFAVGKDIVLRTQAFDKFTTIWEASRDIFCPVQRNFTPIQLHYRACIQKQNRFYHREHVHYNFLENIYYRNGVAVKL